MIFASTMKKGTAQKDEQILLQKYPPDLPPSASNIKKVLIYHPFQQLKGKKFYLNFTAGKYLNLNSWPVGLIFG